MSGENIVVTDRRAYVRKSFCSFMHAHVIIANAELGMDIDSIPDEACYRGILIDISEGGMQITLPEVSSRRFSPDQIIQLQLRTTVLPDHANTTARVVSINPSRDEKSVSMGLQFVDLKQNPDVERQIQKILSCADKI